MSEFTSIEIDFKVYQAIESARKSFAESPNDVLHRLLNVEVSDQPTTTIKNVRSRAWSDDGVTLPHGTKVRMTYNGRLHEGEIIDGKWHVEGKVFDSPSGAASNTALTRKGKHTRLDGWNYWEAFMPDNRSWIGISVLRVRAKFAR